jgi:hypothetical protein
MNYEAGADDEFLPQMASQIIMQTTSAIVECGY